MIAIKWFFKENIYITLLAIDAGDSRVLPSNLLLFIASLVSLGRILSLWVEYECEIPLQKTKWEEHDKNLPLTFF